MRLASLLVICGALVTLTSATYYQRPYASSRLDIYSRKTPSDGQKGPDHRKEQAGQSSSLVADHKTHNGDGNVKTSGKPDQVRTKVNLKGSSSHPFNGPMYLVPVGENWKALESPRVIASLDASGALVIPGIHFGGEHVGEGVAASGSFSGGFGSGIHGESIHHVGGSHGGSIAAAGGLGVAHGESIHHVGGGHEGSIAAAGSIVGGLGGIHAEPIHHVGGVHGGSIAAAGSLVGGLGGIHAEPIHVGGVHGGSIAAAGGSGGAHGESINHVGESGVGGFAASGGLSGSLFLPLPAFLFHHHAHHHGSSVGVFAEPLGGIEYQEKQPFIPGRVMSVIPYPIIKQHGKVGYTLQPTGPFRQGVYGATAGSWIHGPHRESEHYVIIHGLPNIHLSGSFGVTEGGATGQGGIFTTPGNPVLVSLPVAQTAGQTAGQSQLTQFLQSPVQFLGMIFQSQNAGATGGRQPDQAVAGSEQNRVSVAAPLDHKEGTAQPVSSTVNTEESHGGVAEDHKEEDKARTFPDPDISDEPITTTESDKQSLLPDHDEPPPVKMESIE